MTARRFYGKYSRRFCYLLRTVLALCRFAPGPSVVFAAVALAVCRGVEVGEHAKGADGESVY